MPLAFPLRRRARPWRHATFRVLALLACPLVLRGQTTVDNTVTPTLGAFDTTGNNLTLTGTATGNASGVISGSGSLTKSGSGTWTPSANNTLTGPTTVSAGTLSFNGTGGLPNSAVTVDAGATLFAGNFSSYNLGSIAGAGAVSFSFGTVYAGGNNASTTFSGSISGSGTLVKTGTGTLTFNGSAPSGGQLAVSGGTLLFAPSAAANFTAPVLVQSGGTATIAPPDPSRFIRHVSVSSGGAATIALPNSTPLGTTDVSVYSGGALTLGSTHMTTALSNTTLAVSGGASLTLPGEGVVLGGLQNFTGGTITIAPTGFWVVPNLTVGANNLSSSFGGTLTFTGSSFSPNIMKVGTGTWTLVSATNFAPVVKNGYVALESAAAGTGIQLQGGGVRYNTSMTHTGGIVGQTGGGTIDTGTYNVTLSGTLAGGSTSEADTLNKIGSGTLTLTGSSTSFLGKLAINAGTVSVSSSANLGATSGEFASRVAFGGGTLATTASFTSEHPLALNAGGGTLNVASGTTLTWSGAITGAGGNTLTKTGTGTLILSGANTFSGATAINAGRIHLTGTATGSAFTVNSGGTLSGTGTLGALTIASGGTLSPGASPGTLNAGATTFAGGGAFVFELNNATGVSGNNYDLLAISGALTITATAGSRFTINVTSLTLGNVAGLAANFDDTANYSFTFVTTTTGITGFSADKFTLTTSSFQNPFTGSWSIAQNGNNLTLNYTALTAVPEPSTYAALAGAAMLGFAVWRRSRRSTKLQPPSSRETPNNHRTLSLFEV